MPAAVVKVIVTNRAAARTKYGASGWKAIRHAVALLSAADAARGLSTRLLALDSAPDARRVKATAVTTVNDGSATKAFIDAVFATWNPAYLVLLGGPDLVATIPLANPLWDGTPQGDPDQIIASDLPYACDDPISTLASAYSGPTRVIGRIPDLIGVNDPSVLVTQLTATARATPAPVPSSVFALSTKTWRASTTTSIAKLGVASATVRTSPTEGPQWTATDLNPTLHFVNCHGGEFDPHWYGELRSSVPLPVAVDAATYAPKLASGTVVAAECCYAAAHWAPAAAGGAMSVALRCLTGKAIGVFGSATTAYGPATGNEYADVIAGFFAAAVIGGASLGRAALTARQRYVQAEGYLDPTSLATLAQFTLFGDPSVQPFASSGAAGPKVSGTQTRTSSAPKGIGGIATRRAQLSAIGAALRDSTTVSADFADRRAGLSTAELARLSGVSAATTGRVRTFGATGPAASHVRAHLAHVAGPSGPSLVVVREQAGGPVEVRVVQAKSGPVTLTGTVTLQRIATGSKSERDSVVFTTSERHWELRRPTAGAFGPADPQLVALAGRTVTLTGYAGSGVFIVTGLPAD